MIIKTNYANTVRQSKAVSGLRNGKLVDLTPRVLASLHVSIVMKKKELKERLAMFHTLKAEGDSQNKKNQGIIDATTAKVTCNGKEGYVFAKSGVLTSRAETLVIRDMGEA